MKKLLFALVAMSAITASANVNEITPKLGFEKGTLNTGVDYTMMYAANSGVGGYLLLQTESTSKSIESLTALGGHMKFVAWTDNVLNFYVAPGFGIVMTKVGGDSQTGFGPSLKIGSQYMISNTMAVGLERNAISNWFNDKLAQEYTFYQAAFSIRF